MPYVPTRTDGSVMDPRESHFSTIVAAIASQNEILAEVVQALRDGEQADPLWVLEARKTLRESSWALGFQFQGQPPSAEWLREQL